MAEARLQQVYAEVLQAGSSKAVLAELVVELLVSVEDAAGATGAGTATAPAPGAAGEADVTIPAAGEATAPAPGAAGEADVTIPAAGEATAPVPGAEGAGTSTTTAAGEATAPAPGAEGVAVVDDTVLGAGTATAPAPGAAGEASVTIPAAGEATAPVPGAEGEADASSEAVTATGEATAPAPGAVGEADNLEAVDGWDADLTGRALVGITTSVVDLYVPPPMVVPPGAVASAVLVRNSHVSPPLTAATPSDVDYPIHDEASLGAAAIVGTPRVWIDGVDRTQDLDGELVDVDELVSAKGFGDRDAKATVRGLQVWDDPGTPGPWSWLRPGRSQVEVGIINGEDRHVWFAGDLMAETVALETTSFSSTWMVQGPLVQLAQAKLQPLDLMEETDIGIVIPRVVNAVISRRFPPIPTVITGITTSKRGAYGMSVAEYVRTILATAWVGNRQWGFVRSPSNPRQYFLGLPDTETSHWTLSAGAHGIKVNLGLDWTQVTNVYFGRGTLANGHRWMNRRFPYMLPYVPPVYFSGDTSDELLLGSTDADTINNGVTLYTSRLVELGFKVRISSVMLAEHVAATRRLQAQRGLTVDGRVGGQTWTSVWSIGATGADLRSVRLPLAADPRVEPFLYLPNGAVAEPNPEYDPSWPRIEDDIDYAENTSLALGIADASQRLERTKEPALVGTIEMATDFHEGSRFYAQPEQNVTLLGWRGASPFLHIADRKINRKAGTVTLTVDSSCRDAMTVREIIRRNAESRGDPGRRSGAAGRTSSTSSPDITTPFDGESPAGIVPELTVRGGKWSVWPMPLSQVGTLAQVYAETYDPVSEFVLQVFGREVLPSQLNAGLGMVLDQLRPWEDVAVAAFLKKFWHVDGWGHSGEACGYFPKTKQHGGTVTGEFYVSNPVSYRSQQPPFVWVAILARVDCRFRAEFDPQPVDG